MDEDAERERDSGTREGRVSETANASAVDSRSAVEADDGDSQSTVETETDGDSRPAAEREIDGARAAAEAETEDDDARSTGRAEAEGDDADPTSDRANDSMPGVPDPDAADEDRDGSVADREPPEDVRKYARFQKMDGAQYERVNEFLRDRTYVTAREWAIARLCADFRTETGVEMTKIGENLPELVPFMTDTYTPQAVNQARSSFEEKVRKAGATFLYGAMCDFFTAEELDDVMYEATEVAKFLLEVEGIDLSVEQELEAEERISSVMREVREASKELREEDEGTE